MGQVGYGQGRGDAAVFVYDEDVGDAGGGAGAAELGEDEFAAVQAGGGREEEAEFFGEGEEAGRGRAGGRQERARVRHDRGREGVFVVDEVGVVVVFVGVVVVVVGGGGVFVLGSVEEGLALEGSAGGGFGGAQEEGASVEVFAALAGLSAL